MARERTTKDAKSKRGKTSLHEIIVSTRTTAESSTIAVTIVERITTTSLRQTGG